jgi:spore maturation protein SpmB
VEQIINLILESGRAGIDMGLYIMLPIMVVMLALMKLLDAKGVLSWASNYLAPFTRVFGIPGLGIFAMTKLLFVSFAGPIATLTLMDQNGTSRRYIAATLAMVMAMSQANASFFFGCNGTEYRSCSSYFSDWGVISRSVHLLSSYQKP